MLADSGKEAVAPRAQRASAVGRVVDVQQHASAVFPGVNLVVRVRFDVDGHPVTAVVRPSDPDPHDIRAGAAVSIRYNRRDPRSASYSGVGGDAALTAEVLTHRSAIGLLWIVAALTLYGLTRLAFCLHTLRRGRQRGNHQVAATPADANLRVLRLTLEGRRPEEWRVLKSQRPHVPSGQYAVKDFGGWRVLRSADGTVVWPASRVQPVLGADVLTVATAADREPAAALSRRLLAAYVEVLDGTATLSRFVHRPPGESGRGAWWRFLPAPRWAVRLLVERRIRARVRSLGDALGRAGLLRGLSDEPFRDAVGPVRRECAEFGGRLSRRRPAWRVTGAILTASVLAVQLYPGYFGVPRIHVLGREFVGVVTLAYLLLFFLLPPATWVLRRVVGCEQAVLKSAIVPSCPPDAGGCDGATTTETVGDLEGRAFGMLGVPPPHDWDGYLQTLWVGCIAGLAAVLVLNLGLLETLHVLVGVVFVGLGLLAVRALSE
jgi:hypothetical protein